MNKNELEAYSYFTQTYDRLKNLNEPYRAEFDKYDEYYRGYRDSNQYPFAYNYSFNKIIPIIYTVLSRVMAHLYRNSDVVVVKPRQQNDVQRAEVVQGVLNYQLNNMNDVDYQGGSYLIMMQWFLSALVHGKGIVKAFWRHEEETLPKRMDIPVPKFDTAGGQMYLAGYEPRSIMYNAPQITYDGPYMENIPVRFFFPDPDYRSIQKMPCVAHLHVKSLDWLKNMEQKGFFKNIKKVGERATEVNRLKDAGGVDSEEYNMKAKEIEGAYTLEEIATKRHAANNIEIVDFYGKYALEGDIYEVGRGHTMKGREDEVVCTIANHDTIIRLEKNKYGVRPFFDIGAHLNMTRYWDIGVIELIKDIQEAYNNISNLRVHNAMMKVNSMIKVLMDSNVDPATLVWKPFGIIPVDTHEDIEVVEVPDINAQVFREQIDFFEDVIQDITGIYDYTKGVTPARQERVGTMYSIQAMGEARIKLLMMTMDYMGMRPMLKYLTLLNCHHLPSGMEYRVSGKTDAQFGRVFSDALKMDYDFESKYAAMEPALAKEARIQNLLQLSQLWQMDPYVNNYEFKRAILELSDMPQPDRFLRDPRAVAQMMAEQETKALLPDIMQHEAKTKQTEMKITGDLEKTNRKIAGDLAKAMLTASEGKDKPSTRKSSS